MSDDASNAALLERFYAAFARRDGAAMAACYAGDATFTDPVFVDLRGPQVGAMWMMLCERARDLQIEWRNVRADAQTGHAMWDARYTIGNKRRRVDNRIASDFTFVDGRIGAQRDTFDFRRWARMALGAPAALPGICALMQGIVRRRARRSLFDWMTHHPAGPAR